MKKIMITAFILITAVLTTGFITNQVSGFDGLNPSEKLNAYTDLVDVKDTKNYYIETEIKTESNYSYTNITHYDTYMFSSDYSYHLQNLYNIRYDFDFTEKLVVSNGIEDDYYYRVYEYNGYGLYDREYIPYFKTTNSNLKTEIDSFLDSSIFELAEFYDPEKFGVILDFNDLSLAARNQMKEMILIHCENAEFDETKDLLYVITTSGTEVTEIEVHYGNIITNIFEFNQTITIDNDTQYDYNNEIIDAIDITDTSDFNSLSAPKLTLGTPFNIYQDSMSGSAKFFFFEVITAGEYQLDETDILHLTSVNWRIFDLDFNPYYSKIKFKDTFRLNDVSAYIYLEPGIYYFYVSPYSNNIPTSTLTLSLKDRAGDDYSDCNNPNITTIDTNTILTIDINDSTDVEAFKIDGDFEYLCVEFRDRDLGIGVDYDSEYEIESTSSGYQFIGNGEDFILYLTSDEVKSYTVSFKFYKRSDTPIDFSEAYELDIYRTETNSPNYIAMSFSGGVDRYKFEILENCNLYFQEYKVDLRFLDSNLNIIPTNDSNYLYLDPGIYYVEVLNFEEETGVFNLIPEVLGEEVRVLEDEDTTHRIFGYVSGAQDVDMYEITLTETTVLSVPEYWLYNELLVIGVDNTTLVKWNTLFDLELDAGTYHFTFRQPANYHGGYMYNFTLVETPKTEVE